MKALEDCSKSDLIGIIVHLNDRIMVLESAVAKSRKDSSTSSKPPSSDVTKPPKDKSKGKRQQRKIGGQFGHEQHLRKSFSQEQINKTWEYHLEHCPDCGSKMHHASVEPRVVQQVEVVESPIRIEEHRGLGFYCRCCQQVHYAPLPSEVQKGGLLGPRLTALVAYLKCACHASFSTIRRFLRDVMEITISRGQLAKVIQKVSHAMKGVYEDLLRCLPSESRLNVDETGHKKNGRRYWTWCFRAETYTLFKIDPSRGSEVLLNVLGKEFNGVLGCDYFSAYRKYMKDVNVQVQFCLAHLIRDVKFLTTLQNRATQNYGHRVLEALRHLFRIIHRRETMTESRFDKAMEKARCDLLRVAKRAPQRSEAQNMAKRFRLHGKAYFRFITTPGVEPTNNLAEQAIRFVVIDRHITQGTRSERGRQWSERIWTVMATCDQTKQSAFNYIYRVIHAYFYQQPIPTLSTGIP